MTALKTIAVLVTVLIVGVVIALMTFDVEQYKGRIESQAKVAMGRDVSIGDIDLALSLTPAIVLTDVKVANAPWGSRPEMIILPRIDVHTELVPLLFGTINPTTITAQNPDILLEVDKQGRGNWVFDAASDGASTPLSVSNVSISGLKLVYRDAQSGGSADVAAKAIAVAITGALQDMDIRTFQTSGVTVAYKTSGAPLAVVLDELKLDNAGKFDVAGNISGAPLKLNGTLAPIAVLIAMDKGFPAKMEMEALGLKATSDVVFEMVKGRPVAKGTIVIPEVDLSKFAGAAAAQNDGRLFSADPLPWDMISGTDADLKISIGKVVTTRGLTLTDVSLPVKASHGRLTSAPISLTVAGGKIGGDVTLNAAEKSVTLKAQGKGFTAEEIAKTFGKDALITQGPIDLTVNARGAGLSLRDVMASLDGSLIIGMGESRIRNEVLNVPGATALIQVLNIANPFADNDSYSSSRCGVINFQINDGVAHTNQGIALVTDKMSLTSSGQVDLRSELVDLNVRAQAATGVAGGLGQLAQAVKITGALAAPGVTLDQAGLVQGMAGLGEALANGGGGSLGELGALFGLRPKSGPAAPAKPAGSSGDLCARARAWRKG